MQPIRALVCRSREQPTFESDSAKVFFASALIGFSCELLSFAHVFECVCVYPNRKQPMKLVNLSDALARRVAQSTRSCAPGRKFERILVLPPTIHPTADSSHEIRYFARSLSRT